jgi:hypothetical protein
MERGIERALFDPEKVVGDALDMGGDRVAVHAAPGLEGAKDEESERALEDVVALFGQ